MKTIFQPKHTISSVGQQIYEGLTEGSITFKKSVVDPDDRKQIASQQAEDDPSLVGFLFGIVLVFVGLYAAYLHDSALINIGISLIMLVVGFSILRFFPPAIFARYSYVRQAFLFWTMRWPILAIIWTAIRFLPHNYALLIVVDLESIISLAFCWSFFAGRELDRRQLGYLGLIWLGLTLWNVLTATAAGQTWIAPSEFVSVASFVMTVLVFSLRYSISSISFACIVLTSTLFQIPAYNEIFLGVSPGINSHAQLALAVGKLLSGSIFYAMFSFSPASANFGNLKFPVFYFHPARLQIDNNKFPNITVRRALFVLLPASIAVILFFILPVILFFILPKTPVLGLANRHLLSGFGILAVSFWVPNLLLKWDSLQSLLPRNSRRER